MVIPGVVIPGVVIQGEARRSCAGVALLPWRRPAGHHRQTPTPAMPPNVPAALVATNGKPPPLLLLPLPPCGLAPVTRSHRPCRPRPGATQATQAAITLPWRLVPPRRSPVQTRHPERHPSPALAMMVTVVSAAVMVVVVVVTAVAAVTAASVGVGDVGDVAKPQNRPRRQAMTVWETHPPTTRPLLAPLAMARNLGLGLGLDLGLGLRLRPRQQQRQRQPWRYLRRSSPRCGSG